MNSSVQKKMFLGGLSLACFMGSFSAWASPLNFDFSSNVSDSDYKKIVLPIANPMRMNFMGPASPTGMVGFDVGLGATFFSMPSEAKDLIKTYVKDGKDLPSALAIPRLTAQKGLPADFDLALNVAMVPGSEMKLIGAGVQYAFLNLISPIPTLSARLSYSSLMGLKALESTAMGGEIVASVGIPPGITILEPYVGLGLSKVSAKSNFTLTTTGTTSTAEISKSAEWTDKYAIIGARLSLFPFVGICADAQLGSEQTTYNARLSFRF